MAKNENWNIRITGDRVTFRRIDDDGDTIEVYAPVDPAKASIYAAAIIQGYQPPRDLPRLDTPAG